MMAMLILEIWSSHPAVLLPHLASRGKPATVIPSITALVSLGLVFMPAHWCLSALYPEDKVAVASSQSSGLYDGFVDAHGVGEAVDVHTTRALTIVSCKLAVGALVMTLIVVMRREQSRISRLALLFFAFIFLGLWYLFASGPDVEATVDSPGIYDNAFDVHGMLGENNVQTIDVFAVVSGRLVVGAVVIGLGIAMRHMLSRFEKFALTVVTVVFAIWYLLAPRSGAGVPASSSGIYHHAVDAHGTVEHSEASIAQVLGVIAGRFAAGVTIIFVAALIRRFLSRVGLVSCLRVQSLRLPVCAPGQQSAFFKSWVAAKDNSLLILCFAFWYYGNYEHNICNKVALRDTGGADGFPLTIATCQLGVGVLYAVFLWIAPDAREKPTVTSQDLVSMLPVSFAAASAHAGSVFAVSAGALSFGQIVKSCEPAFAALIGTGFYGCTVSSARWLCLFPIIGGVALCTIAELDFTWAALLSATVANVFAAIKSNENKRLLAADGIKDRLGSVGNQYAITTIQAFLLLIPLTLYREGHKFSLFLEVFKSNRDVRWNIVASGWWFYIYNEVATFIVKKTGPVTQSIANTAKRAIIILLAAVVLGESLSALKVIGCTIAIGGVVLYSEVDKIVAMAAPYVMRVKIPGSRMSASPGDTCVFETPQKRPPSDADPYRLHSDSISTKAPSSPSESSSPSMVMTHEDDGTPCMMQETFSFGVAARQTSHGGA